MYASDCTAWWQARTTKLSGSDGMVLLRFGTVRERERDRRARVRVREGARKACPPFGLAALPGTGVRPPGGMPGLHAVGH